MRCIHSSYHEPDAPFFCYKKQKRLKHWTKGCHICDFGEFKAEPRWHTGKKIVQLKLDFG